MRNILLLLLMIFVSCQNDNKNRNQTQNLEDINIEEHSYIQENKETDKIDDTLLLKKWFGDNFSLFMIVNKRGSIYSYSTYNVIMETECNKQRLLVIIDKDSNLVESITIEESWECGSEYNIYTKFTSDTTFTQKIEDGENLIDIDGLFYWTDYKITDLQLLIKPNGSIDTINKKVIFRNDTMKYKENVAQHAV
jgi:hypothetical protein